MSGAYGPALARAHASGFGEIERRAARALLLRLKAAGVQGGIIADLGCGAGGLLAEVLAAGFQGWGVDISAPMIDLACQRAPGADLRVGSLHETPLPQGCAAITAIGEALSYGAGPDDFARLAGRVYEALAPGGVFVFDVILQGVPSLDSRHWREEAGWAMMAAVIDKGETLTREIVTFHEAAPGQWGREEAHHLQRLYRPETLAADLGAAGFTGVEQADSYDEAPFLPRRGVFWASRAKSG